MYTRNDILQLTLMDCMSQKSQKFLKIYKGHNENTFTPLIECRRKDDFSSVKNCIKFKLIYI